MHPSFTVLTSGGLAGVTVALAAALLVPPAGAETTCAFSSTVPSELAAPGPHTEVSPLGGLASLNQAHSAQHNQLLLGDSAADSFYLYHLPLFMNDPRIHPHNFQVIVEARLMKPEHAAILREDRAATPDMIYSAAPDKFDQTLLALDYPGHPPLPKLGAAIYRGHLERGGVSVFGVDASGHDVKVPLHLDRVVHYRELAPDAGKGTGLHYVVFGGSLLAHALTAPPDFDQIVRVEIESQSELPADGLYLTIRNRSNKVEDRLFPGQTISCSQMDGEAPTVTISVENELYCEVGEVGQMRFQPSRDCPAS
jgi:hypothetical protein